MFSYVPEKEMNVTNVYEINHIRTAEMKSMKNDSRSCGRNCVKTLKKITTSTGFFPVVTSRYRCDGLTN